MGLSPSRLPPFTALSLSPPHDSNATDDGVQTGPVAATKPLAKWTLPFSMCFCGRASGAIADNSTS